MATVLRIGDTQVRPEEAIEISVKTSKCTALARPKSWKRFGRRRPVGVGKDKEKDKDAMEEDEETATFAQLRMRTEYYLEQDKAGKDGAKRAEADSDPPSSPVDHRGAGENDEGEDGEEKGQRDEPPKTLVKVEKEELVRGYKYGATFLPVGDGGFPRLRTRRGIDVCGFFQMKNFRRELEMGEVYYVWADPASPMQQVALSSIVQAMYEKGVMAIARWVSRDDMDPKMGVLYPSVFEEVDCLLWVQVSGFAILS